LTPGYGRCYSRAMSEARWTAKAVRGLRARLGLTQEAFARKLDVAFSTVNRWENGKVEPKGPYAKRLVALSQAKLLAARAVLDRAVQASPPEIKLGRLRPLRVVIPATDAAGFGGPSVEQMAELWGKVPASVAIEGGEIFPIW